MTFEEYQKYDALDLADLVRRKQITAGELAELAIAWAEAINPSINAVIQPLYELGRQMAADGPSGPFGGVPFLIKDLGVHIKGTPLSNGSRGFKGQISDTDSRITQQFREAGLVFLGKTNTPELGFTPFTEPALFGPTRNPWSLDHTPGGSSGGSAAAVAAGIAPIATASDGGGSIRIPASCCGLFGLKPSRGRVSLGPHQGEAWSGATMEHCVSRSVRDSAALLDVILQGDTPGEPYRTQPPQRPYLQEAQSDPPALRIGFSTSHTLGHEIHPECQAAVHHTVKLLEALGHQVEETPLPYRREDLIEVFIVMIGGETVASIEEMGQFLGRKPRPSDMEPTTWLQNLLGRSLSAGDFTIAMRRWNDIGRRLGSFHQQYDLLLTPVAAQPPFRIGTLQPTAAERRLISLITTFNLQGLLRRNVEPLAEKIFDYIPFTPFANMTGQPSMSVPLHWTADGLPTGSLFTAAIGREDQLFQLAGQLERAQPWFGKVP